MARPPGFCTLARARRDFLAGTAQAGEVVDGARGDKALPAVEVSRDLAVHRASAQKLSPVRNRKFADSPLEGDGFEPSVPGRIPARCELAVARRHRLAGDNDDSAVKAARAFVNLHRRPAAGGSL